MRILLLLLLSITANGQNLVFQDLFPLDTAKIGCYRIPALIQASNGDLLVAIDERVEGCGDLKWNDNINIVLRRSTDEGITWQPIERIADFPHGESASDPSFILDEQTGSIFLFYNYMDRVNAKDVYRLHVLRSDDHGITWSDPTDITSQITRPEWAKDFQFITSGHGAQTKDGLLLHTLVNLQKGLHVFASADHGDSWYLMDTPVNPANESKIIELPDRNWYISSRVNGSGVRYSHVSDDQGATWMSTAESGVQDPGCNGSLINLKVNGHEYIAVSHASNPEARERLQLSLRGFKKPKWLGQTIYPGPAAYSSMIQLQSGDIALVFEKDGYKENAFVRIPLSRLQLPTE